MRWPKLILQKRYRVEWLDFMGTINGRLSEVEPAACWSEGVLVKNRKDYLVLASSQYTEESKDPTGDYVCLLKGACVSCKRL